MPHPTHRDRPLPGGTLVAGLCTLVAGLACGDSSPGPGNTRPVAVVAPVPGAFRGDTVIMDGTGSYDADGDSLGFAWTLVSAPAGSAAQLSPADGVSPAFVADRTGEYVVSLVVSDRRTASDPAGTTISVEVPAPAIMLTTPQDQDIVTASPVTVSGVVDDPAAAVAVNGAPVDVDAGTGSFSAEVPLAAGSNLVRVVAENPSGVDTAAVTVILNTADAPVVHVTQPKDGIVVGRAYLVGSTPQPEAVAVRGTIQVFTTEAANVPTLTVDGVPATLADTSFKGCPTSAPKRCFKFSATVSLGLGVHPLSVAGTDVLGGTDTARVTVVADVAWRPTDAEWTDENKKVGAIGWSGPTPRLAALTQTNPANPRQNNRAHEVDGCSVPVPELDGTWRNDPMHAATQNTASTEFGSGTRPPGDYFVHGQGPSRNLPCNAHDVCYQTVGSSKATCDTRFYNAMRAVCAAAYPTIDQPVLHPVYVAEQSSCYNWAKRYYDGVRTSAGQGKFDKRQAQFAYP